jgi:hypothetical protein
MTKADWQPKGEKCGSRSDQMRIRCCVEERQRGSVGPIPLRMNVPAASFAGIISPDTRPLFSDRPHIPGSLSECVSSSNLNTLPIRPTADVITACIRAQG